MRLQPGQETWPAVVIRVEANGDCWIFQVIRSPTDDLPQSSADFHSKSDKTIRLKMKQMLLMEIGCGGGRLNSHEVQLAIGNELRITGREIE